MPDAWRRCWMRVAAWTTTTAMPPTNNFTALVRKILTLNINSMKNIVCFVVYITTLICLSFAQNTDTNSMCEACKIVHIDSVGNYYVLYAKKTDNKYKGDF